MSLHQKTVLAPLARRLLYAKAFYFCFYAAMGGYTFFLSLYYKQLGLDDRQIGLVVGLPPLMTLVSAPLWGQLRDRMRHGRWLLPLACLATLPLVAAIGLAHDVGLLVPLTLVYAFFLAPIAPLADHMTLTLLGEQRHLYGRQRIWGAVGFGLAAWVVGLLSERLGLRAIFVSFMCMMALCAVTALGLGGAQPPAAVERGGSGLGELLRKPSWLLFLLSMFLVGASVSAVNNFYPLFLQSLGGRVGLYGFSIALSTLSELPIFLLSSRLLRRWGSGGVLLMAMSVYVLRWLLLSAAWSPELAVASQLLHGLTFSALWVGGVSYAQLRSPERLGATAQGLFSGTVSGISAVGSFAGGLIYATAGPVALFRVAAGAVVLALGAFLAARALDG
jgi:PPP family 3-phenylpropionic acid transporter